jgi:hypothetical protein
LPFFVTTKLQEKAIFFELNWNDQKKIFEGFYRVEVKSKKTFPPATLIRVLITGFNFYFHEWFFRFAMIFLILQNAEHYYDGEA